MKHVLIVGPSGSGKSTLLHRVLKELGKPVFGFETKLERTMTDPELGDPIYIHTPGQPRRYTDENLVGYCKNRKSTTRAGTFNCHAPNLLLPVPEGGVICFDELGPMEGKEADFRDAVLSRLDGNIPVIAAVRDKDAPFLNAVRQHPRCQCFFVTDENHEDLFEEIMTRMRANLDQPGKE